MSPNLATFLFEAANFAVLAAALAWVFFRPVQSSIDRRRAALEDERRRADEARREAERMLAEATACRREAEASLGPLRAALRRDAEAECECLLAAAHQRAEEERAALAAELARTRRAHAAVLSGDAAAATRKLVEALLAEIGGPDLDLALVRAAARSVEPLAEGTVLVEAARPLADDARRILRDALGPALDGQPVRVVPGLIAGVRVTTGAGMVDASVAGLARHAERELAARIERAEQGDG